MTVLVVRVLSASPIELPEPQGFHMCNKDALIRLMKSIPTAQPRTRSRAWTMKLGNPSLLEALKQFYRRCGVLINLIFATFNEQCSRAYHWVSTTY
jgi:hypothetical protein